MSIPTYIEGYPQDGSSLGSTKAQIRANLDGTFETLSVDHINNNGQPNSGTPGYHNVIHFQDQGNLYTTPPTVTGVTQMYTNTSNGAQQLMLDSTAGNPYQQTVMIDAQYANLGTRSDKTAVNPANSKGSWTYLAGGLVLQYGFSTGLSSSGQTITLPFPFLHDIYIVQAQVTYSTISSSRATVAVKVNGPASFDYFFLTDGSSGTYSGIFWTAIGSMI